MKGKALGTSRVELLALLGGKCVAEGYGITDIEMLQLDHKNDDGSTDREKFNGNSTLMYVYYLKHPEEANARLQILCANHNWKKRFALESTKLPPPINPSTQIPYQPKIRFFNDWTDSEGARYIVWGDNPERLIPAIVRCNCGSLNWQLLGEQEKNPHNVGLYLRCPNCGEDHQAELR